MSDYTYIIDRIVKEDRQRDEERTYEPVPLRLPVYEDEQQQERREESSDSKRGVVIIDFGDND